MRKVSCRRWKTSARCKRSIFVNELIKQINRQSYQLRSDNASSLRLRLSTGQRGGFYLLWRCLSFLLLAIKCHAIKTKVNKQLRARRNRLWTPQGAGRTWTGGQSRGHFAVANHVFDFATDMRHLMPQSCLCHCHCPCTYACLYSCPCPCPCYAPWTPTSMELRTLQFCSPKRKWFSSVCVNVFHEQQVKHTCVCVAYCVCVRGGILWPLIVASDLLRCIFNFAACTLATLNNAIAGRQLQRGHDPSSNCNTSSKHCPLPLSNLSPAAHIGSLLRFPANSAYRPALPYSSPLFLIIFKHERTIRAQQLPCGASWHICSTWAATHSVYMCVCMPGCVCLWIWLAIDVPNMLATAHPTPANVRLFNWAVPAVVLCGRNRKPARGIPNQME